MRLSPRIPLLTLGVLFALAPGSSASDKDEDPIHVCKDENGNIVYQSNPCPKLAKKNSASDAPAPAPPKPRAPAPPKAPVAPPPSAPARPAPSPARQAPSSWAIVPRTRGAPPTVRRRLGKQTFPTGLADAAPPTSPSFTSPSATWRTFLAALQTGDNAAAAACLTPAALHKIGGDGDSFPLDELRRTVSSFTRIEDEGDVGVFWSIHGTRAGRRPKWIFFEETRAGEWKIAGI